MLMLTIIYRGLDDGEDWSNFAVNVTLDHMLIVDQTRKLPLYHYHCIIITNKLQYL